MIYRMLTQLAGPLLRRQLRRRAARGKEDVARLSERFGIAGVVRPPGKLIWLHAASVGEAVALLALITAIKARYPAVKFLLTTGTVTSAAIMARRLPLDAIHQYVPLDCPGWVKAFLTHWHPDAAIWTESELWPNLLHGLQKRGVPVAMINGRLSANSARRWKYLGRKFGKLLEIFTVRLAQSEQDAIRFATFGVPFQHVGNLKLAVEPAPVDPTALRALQQAIGNRPFWLAASTHPGEEALVIEVHQRLATKFPELLTIIVPRHADRRDEIAAKAALPLARRSTGALPEAGTALYLADTMGELATFYRLSPIAFIGGSLTFDGHSPVEAAQGDVAIVYGPKTRNNASIAQLLEAAGAAVRVADATELATIVEAWLHDPASARQFAQAAKAIADNGQDVVARIMQALQPVFAKARIA